jgi:N-acetylglucosamine kinase-like BadF-type ATPase
VNEGSIRVVGVDGGGTHTRFLLADGSGRLLGSATGGPGLLGAGADEEVAARITEAVRGLTSRSGDELPIDAVCAGLAGAAGRPDSTSLVRDRLTDAMIARTVLVVTDSEVAFRDAFGAEEGVLVIAGTGSVAMGCAARGTLERVGGWGSLVGDEGSAYELGLQGLRAAIRGAEGRGEATTLTPTIFGALDVESPRGAFEWTKTAAKADLAALAPRVVGCADGGDGEADRIVGAAVEALLRHALALRARVSPGGSPPPVALVGGLVEPGGVLRGRVVAALEARGWPILDRSVDPARGAVQAALEALGC